MKNFIALVFMAAALSSCAQTNKLVVKAQAYYTIPTPGTIPVDVQGRPLEIKRNKVYSVYVELKPSAIEWTNAWVDNKMFAIISMPVKDKQAVIGKRRTDGLPISMEAAKGNSVVLLELSPKEAFRQPPQTLKANELLLQGKSKGKLFYYKITKVTELASPEYQ